MADLTFSVLFAGFFAVVTIWQSWAWALLPPFLPLGMVLRRAFARARTLLLGSGTALVLFAANSGVIGARLQADPEFAAGIYPSYFFGLVVALCWLLHTLLAVVLLGAGCLFTEAVVRASTPSAPPPRRTRRPKRRT
jgi:hypothetical protein